MAVEQNHYCWNPFGNFLFSEEEYSNSDDRDVLKLRCVVCGEIFLRKKSVIKDTVENFNRNRTALMFCSTDCGKREIEIKCDCCGKIFKRVAKFLRKTTSGKYFCSPQCKAKFYEDNSITRKKQSVDRSAIENLSGALFSYDEYECAQQPKNVGKKLLRIKCVCCGKELFLSNNDINEAILKNKRSKLYCSLKCYYTTEKSVKDNALEKRKETCRTKYGMESVTGVKEFKEKNILTHRNNYVGKYLGTLNRKRISVLNKAQYINNESTITLKCEQCGHVWDESNRISAREIFCPNCLRHNISKGERELASYIQGLFLCDETIILNDRMVMIAPKEIDIAIPRLRIGIEYDGNYWHSEKFFPQESIRVKDSLCEERGFDLIHIYEWEWKYYNSGMQAVLKSMLLEETAPVTDRYEIKKISHKEFDDFCMKNFKKLSQVSEHDLYGVFVEEWCLAVFEFADNTIKNLVTERMLAYEAILQKIAEFFKQKTFNFEVDTDKVTRKWIDIVAGKCCHKITEERLELKSYYCDNYGHIIYTLDMYNERRTEWFRIFNSGNLKLSYQCL